MGYIEQKLIAGEQILYRVKLHWVVFKWSAIWLVIFLILFTGKEGSLSVSVAPGILVLAIILIILASIKFATSEFGLTSKRILMKKGLIRRHSKELLLTKIEGIQVKQGIVGRIFGYGTIIVTGTGGIKTNFDKISNPLEFRRRVQEQLSTIEESKKE